MKLVNRKSRLKGSLIFDEFPTIYFTGMDALLSTSRSDRVSCTLAVHYDQLKKDYGAEQADVIVNIVGNVISGQAMGDTAKKLSENFGKILQHRQSTSINSSDTSISRSSQLDYAIPAAKISDLSSGDFVGIVADNPDQMITLKMSHSEIQNGHESIASEEESYKDIPIVDNVTYSDLIENYSSIKADIERLLNEEFQRIVARNQDVGNASDTNDNIVNMDSSENQLLPGVNEY
ncbi:TraM recognition site of TraD and TraG [Pedobacter westerhofensis]|uniref:TraM recognition site of TraD and TraG n=2 Tax=Pedobacter westerhofensis TaxID=425512 RepID=A0A521E944_9SPHI|nr:TraM recognition site of TraD and TraG [Pedobacter westerhofensis]